jgi:hypothetical protein
VEPKLDHVDRTRFFVSAPSRGKMWGDVVSKATRRYTFRQSNHGSKHRWIDNREEMVQALTVAVAVHTATPLGNTDPGEEFLSKTSTEREKRGAMNPDRSHIDNVLQQAKCAKERHDKGKGFPLSFSDPHGLVGISGASGARMHAWHALRGRRVVNDDVGRRGRGSK